jgi:hypothetical protein
MRGGAKERKINQKETKQKEKVIKVWIIMGVED